MRAGLIAINLAAVIFGTAALFGKLNVSPFWIVGVRSAFAVAALLAFGRARGRLTLYVPSPLRSKVALTAGVLALHWLTFFASVQLAGVAVATLTFAAFPLFTTVLETLSTGRRPRLVEFVAGAAIIVAVSLLGDLHGTTTYLWGGGLGLASALLFAWFGITAKTLTGRLSPLTLSIWQNIVIAVGTAPLLPFVGPRPATSIEFGSLALLGIVTTALMHQLYLFALTRLSATTCSAFAALEPVYAVSLAAIFFGDPITPWIVLSGALILGASGLIIRAEGR